MPDTSQLRSLAQHYADACASGDVDALVQLYAYDGVLISPNPASVDVELGDWVQGHDALRAYLGEVFAPMTPGRGFRVLEVLTGTDSAVVIRADGGSITVDTLLYDEQGLIATHFDTAPQASPLAPPPS